MTNNPLALRRAEPTGYSQPFERTGRPYVFDLCDHYNRTMHPTARERGGEWFVDNQGQVRLGQNLEWSEANTRRIAATQERERDEWIRNNREHDNG